MRVIILFLFLFILFNGLGQLSGTYYVGQNEVYPDLDSAFYDLNSQGMGGSVEFVVKNGIYDQLVLNDFDPSPDSLIIRSESGIPDSVEFNLAVFTNTKKVTIDGLMFQMGNTSSQESIVRIIDCDKIYLKHCKIEDTVTTNYNLNEASLKIEHDGSNPGHNVYIDSCIIYNPLDTVSLINYDLAILEVGNDGNVYYSNDTIVGEWRMNSWNTRSGHNTYVNSSFTTLSGAVFDTIQDCHFQFYVSNYTESELKASYISYSIFEGDSNSTISLDIVFELKNCHFYPETHFSYNLQANFLDNHFLGETNFNFCNNNFFSGNSFYSESQFSSGNHNIYENNRLIGPIFFFAENDGLAVNNQFFSDVQIAYGTLDLYHNNFGDNSSINDYGSGRMYNNCINSYNGNNIIHFHKMNNWASHDPVTSYYKIFDESPSSYDPIFTSALDLHINNPALYNRALFLTEPLTQTDIDDDTRTGYRSIGADEVCLDVQLPDTIFVQCGSEYMLKSCQAVIDSGYTWHPGSSMIDSTAQNLLVSVDSNTTVWLEDIAGNIIAHVVLSPLLLPDGNNFSITNNYCGEPVFLASYLPDDAVISWNPSSLVDDSTSNMVMVYPDSNLVVISTVQTPACGNIIDTFLITNNPQPIASFWRDSMDCTTGYFDAEVPCYDSLLWEFGDQTTSNLMSPTHNYSNSGYYNVSLTVWNEGLSFSDNQLFSFPCNGLWIENEPGKKNVNVYPNPTSDLLHISGIESGMNQSVRVMDLMGQLVDEVMLEGSSIDVSHLESGVYLLEVDRSVVRFVKE